MRENTLYKSAISRVEKPLIESVLQRTRGNQLEAAKILGINRNTMRTKIRKLGIEPRKYRGKKGTGYFFQVEKERVAESSLV